MAARNSTSSGNTFLTCSMVQAPVKVYLASSDERVSFNTIHRECSSKIETRKHCPKCDKAIDNTVCAKGYSMGDRMVLVEEADLEPLKAADKKIELVEFAPASAVDHRRLYGKTYYLGAMPKTPDDAFRLLFATMADTKLVALARFTRSGRERMAVVSADESLGCFVLQTLYYSEELRSADAVARPSQKPVPADHMALAHKLVKSMVRKGGTFDYEAYRDDYSDKVRAMCQAKLDGAPAAAPVEARETTDLMAALKASLQGTEAA